MDPVQESIRRSQAEESRFKARAERARTIIDFHLAMAGKTINFFSPTVREQIRKEMADELIDLLVAYRLTLD